MSASLSMSTPKPNSVMASKMTAGNRSHHAEQTPSWWFDCYTTAGRKSENQDSVVMTTCLLNYLEQRLEVSAINEKTAELTQQSQSSASLTVNQLPVHQLPVLALLADGVSACQFPKQASRLAVDIMTEHVIKGLVHLQRQAQQSIKADKQFKEEGYRAIFDDGSVAGIIKSSVIKANDSMYFSQAYQRVAPLLSTLSGVLCIGDRVHLFHTGDSRIYRVSAGRLMVLTEDHRIHHGQDKGALSAALGADTRIDLQQSVFTLHQNEYLVLMTDGVYEFINPAEMQFELSSAASYLDQNTGRQPLNKWQLAEQLCTHALNEGSHDNLSVIVLAMGAASHNLPVPVITEQALHTNLPNQTPLTKTPDREQAVDNQPKPQLKGQHSLESDSDDYDGQETALQYKLLTGLAVGDSIDGFVVTDIIARTARSDVYLVQDDQHQNYVLKSPSLMTVDDGHYLRDFLKERKIGLSLSKHSRAGAPAYNQTNPNLYQSIESDTKERLLNGSSSRKGGGTSSAGFGLGESGLLRYYPVPASSTYLYHLTEYIEGESLRAFMARNGPCDVWQTHDLLTKIGMAVRVMHRNYLLHQDIKPENILLTKSGAVKLIDFGSAASSILKDNTRPPVGDLHYAAPEYYTDAPKGVYSDLFSIAVIGFELLTGSRPFTAQMLMNEASHLVVPAERLRQHQVPASSQQALIRALHRNANVRYQAIGEFLQDFNPDNSAALSDPEPLIKRNPLLVWHGICLIQGVLIVFLLIRYLPQG